MAAEAALGTLPFSTVELEEISGFLNQTGDYAYSLCSSASAVGFSDEDVEKLTELLEAYSVYEKNLFYN